MQLKHTRTHKHPHTHRPRRRRARKVEKNWKQPRKKRKFLLYKRKTKLLFKFYAIECFAFIIHSFHSQCSPYLPPVSSTPPQTLPLPGVALLLRTFCIFGTSKMKAQKKMKNVKKEESFRLQHEAWVGVRPGPRPPSPATTRTRPKDVTV